MSRTLSRRAILGSVAAAACAPSLPAQQLAGEPPGRIAPLSEIVNVFELQEMAKRKLPEPVYATIAGTNRAALERMTFRPRLMVNVTQLDLSLDLLGTKLFAPILLGPVWRQESFHPDAEIASARGAAASKSLMIVSSRASKPLPQIIEAAGESPMWFQAYPEADPQATVSACQAAVKLGCKAVCITVGAPREATTSPKTTWETIDRIKQSVSAPLLVKGILNADEAAAAATKGVQAIVISNHGAPAASGLVDPLEMLPAIVKATGSKIPILIDGSFRRGTDVLKALALGARAVLVARPAMWGLAAYGAEGVQAALEMLQTELARAMAMCGKPTLAAIDASLVKIHRR
ncbi:MAG TPA: alpha-hydroxy-acid oxidizing protein [Bryobacteraceae bacterium]|nr:alpha-hydroxy-acid oxidizing protein [Bryobacteraceae bacterium]